MEQNNDKDYQAIWGEEWQWPMVEQVTDSMLSAQADECLVEQKTEEEIRMEKYIVENILEESQHGNSSGSSSDTYYDHRAPNHRAPNTPVSTKQSSVIFSFPPPTTYSMWPTSTHSSTTTRTLPTHSSTYNPSSRWLNQGTTYQEMNRPIRHYSLPVSTFQPIPTVSQMSTSRTYPSIARSQSSPTSPSLFRNFNPSTLPTASSSRVRRNSSRSSDQCGFCKRNGEIPVIYTGHILSDSQGRVVCPQLRVLVCEICGATGDRAHTWSYCPLNTRAPSVALPTLLKSTPRQSDGKWRRRGVDSR